MLLAADLFAGAGGTSHGAQRSGAAKLELAVNHWDVAVRTHSMNFPEARHFNSRVDAVNPLEYDGKLHLIFASPECTHHSNARGGRPMDDQRRSGAQDLLPWLKTHKPEWFVVENVREFLSWGPLGRDGRPIKDKKGVFFDQWLQSLKGAGYQVEYQLLNAADFGAHTSRVRLFVIGRRKNGRRNPRINWPQPTHDKHGRNGLPRWRPAHEVIDWTLPCPSIFGRKRPLAAKTLRRISVGLRKFCGPYMVQWDQQGGGNVARSVDDPVYTILTKANTGVAVPVGVNMKGGSDAFDPNGPLPTMTAHARHCAVALPFISSQHQHNTGTDTAEPIPTILAGGNHHAVAMPFVANMTHQNKGSEVTAPLPTIVTAPHHYVVAPFGVPFFGERAGQPPRSHDFAEPMPAVTSHGAGGVAVPFQFQLIGRGAGRARDTAEPLPTIIAARENHGVVVPVPFSIDTAHGDDGHSGDRAYPLDQPLGSTTTKRSRSVCVPILTNYYGTGHADSVDEPVATLTAKGRHALAMFRHDLYREWPPHWSDVDMSQHASEAALISAMIDLDICDVGFRMLNNSELARAQGFDMGYLFAGSTSDVTRQIGNSVSPCVAEAITRALAS